MTRQQHQRINQTLISPSLPPTFLTHSLLYPNTHLKKSSSNGCQLHLHPKTQSTSIISVLHFLYFSDHLFTVTILWSRIPSSFSKEKMLRPRVRVGVGCSVSFSIG
ncbi:hypothetical protein L6452_19215 [Arctium lappa]|uniref:Uncharacterized protein n=1 Tax=Arctium lappa TaxID=4217 RepID=A0ACB9B8C5_ARCLA|nr:hypothetical protein L6452_19215 [Arctium lappa]